MLGQSVDEELQAEPELFVQGTRQERGRCDRGRSDCPTTAVHSPSTGPQVQRLFDVYQGPQFTLLAFGPNAVGAMPDLVWPTRGAELRRYAVHSGPGADDGSRDLVDTTGLVASTYGIVGDTLVLVRPDGYIGDIVSADWTTAFAATARALSPM